MRRFAALGLVGLSLFVVGCSKPSMVGKWNVTGIPNIPAGSTVTMDFTETKSTGVISMTQMGMELKITSEDTYTFDGKTLSMTNVSVKIDEGSLPASVKAYLPMMKKEMEKAQGKTTKGEIKFDGDTATWTTEQGPVTLTKVKA
jgi:hypothetical protein